MCVNSSENLISVARKYEKCIKIVIIKKKVLDSKIGKFYFGGLSNSFTSKNEFKTSLDTFNASSAVSTKYIMLIILCLGDNFFSAIFWYYYFKLMND